MPFSTTYQPLPIAFTHGKGVWLYDQNGEAYLDTFAGIGVSILGHAHPAVTHAIQEQAGKLIHTSNSYLIPEQDLLAQKLLHITGMEQIFFANSGAEANEAAIKLTRLFARKKNIETPEIIVMERAFHGRTMATLSASGNRKIQAGFEPLFPGFIRVPFNNISSIQKIAKHHNNVVAVMLEPIQGEGGINCAEKEYLKQLSKICDQQDWLLILDEVQTGNGRTGHWYAYMGMDITPDIFTTAKGLANGIPIGACLMRGRACNLFKPGNHGSTFGGNPFACAVANTVLNIIEQESLLNKVKQNSLWFMQQLQEKLGHHPGVKAIRGKGYMIGIELTKPALAIKTIALSEKLLLNVTSEYVIRLLPALIIEQDELSILLERLLKCINIFFA